MKFLLRNISLYALSLFVLQLIFAGVTVSGGLGTYIIGGIILTIFFYTIKPLLQLFALPINFATLGLFTIIINALILYMTTVLLPNISIIGFIFSGFSFLGFTVPQITFNAFFAYIISAIVISCVTNTINWLFE